MELKFAAEEKGSPKRDCRFSRARSQKSMKSNFLEAIAQVHGGTVVSQSDDEGVVRMKIVLRKQDLKQMVALLGSGKTGSHHQASPSSLSLTSLTAASSLEQRLYAMKRRHLRRVHLKGSLSTWRPALQSIPEEL